VDVLSEGMAWAFAEHEVVQQWHISCELTSSVCNCVCNVTESISIHLFLYACTCMRVYNACVCTLVCPSKCVRAHVYMCVFTFVFVLVFVLVFVCMCVVCVFAIGRV
jgi:hypothetical protein